MIYDIIVIGAGSGGLNIASFMNKAGFKVLLIEKTDKNIGGDCLNFGCVPSKALIHVSKLAYNAKESQKFGFEVSGNIDMKKVMDYVRKKKEVIRVHENAEYFRSKGMDVVLGTAKFEDENQISVDDNLYKGKKILIATGSRPRKLNVPGVNKVREKKNYLTNENIFDLEKLPKKLVVIGGGPIGIEMSQAFSRLGTEVTVIEHGARFLPKESTDISEVLLRQLKKEGIKFYFSSNIKEFISHDEISIDHEGKEIRLKFDKVLVSIGRVLNIENLDLEKAGITINNGRIKLNECLTTTNKNVYVCGDVAGSYQFTHAAELHTSVLLNNFFSPIKKKLCNDNLSWVTYTSPEIATFGLNEIELNKRGTNYEKLVLTFKDDDKSIVDDYTDGRLEIFITKNKILGGSMVAINAGELFQELVLANSAGLNIKKIFNKIYPYPTASRVNKKIISDYYSKKLTPFTKKVLKFMY